MRVLLKRSAEFMLSRSGLLRVARARHRSGTLILAYHNVVPSGEQSCGDSSLHLTQNEFGRQLDALAETHEIVTLQDLLTRDSAHSQRPHAVITFDDAYQGAITAGIQELRRRSLPATVFVPPEFVGARSFWWDELAVGFDGALPDNIRRFAIDDLAGKYDRVHEWAAARGYAMHSVPEYATAATESQLLAAEATGIVTFGSHSWSHPNLARLGVAELRRELAESWTWLQQRFHAIVPWLSYPYGISSSEVRFATEKAGYDGALAIDGGWLFGPAHARRYSLPRANVPAGLSTRGYTILASGLLPLRG